MGCKIDFEITDMKLKLLKQLSDKLDLFADFSWVKLSP
jgi:hypothetical protein